MVKNEKIQNWCIIDVQIHFSAYNQKNNRSQYNPKKCIVNSYRPNQINCHYISYSRNTGKNNSTMQKLRAAISQTYIVLISGCGGWIWTNDLRVMSFLFYVSLRITKCHGVRKIGVFTKVPTELWRTFFAQVDVCVDVQPYFITLVSFGRLFLL